MDMQLNISQKQILSTKMIQSLNVLQMNTQELQDYLKEEALNNPLLEYDDALDFENEKREIIKKLEWLGSPEEQNRYYSLDTSDENNKDSFDFISENDNSLAEYISSQFMLHDLSRKEREVLEYLIYCMDDNGYMKEDIKSISAQLNCDTSITQSCLALLKTADPAGVGAQNLPECLMLQIERKGLANPHLKEIVENHLDLVGKNQLREIAKKLHISLDETLKYCYVIKKLNPKPGNGFFKREYLSYIKPDVAVISFEGKLDIMINDNSSEKVIINAHYSKLLADSNVNKEDFTYIKDKLTRAEWVLQCVRQRNSTLMKVVQAIVCFQYSFFEKGTGNINPLLMKDVAEQINMHESVVSRTVKGKYLQCKWGVFPLAYFFSKKLNLINSATVITPEYVKSRIQYFIDQEDAQKPYSDQLLSEMLNKENIEISRRTVAKYRDEMNIRDTRGRKKYLN